MTLNNIIDDILLIARNSSVSESEHLSRIQIEQWIHSYRAKLIKEDIDKGRDVNPMYISTIKDIHLDKEQYVDGHYVFKGDKKLPKLIDFHYMPGVIAVKDKFGNLIQIGSETKMKFQKYRKYNCDDYIAYIKNDDLYVDGTQDLLEYVDIDVIAENPSELVECYDPNSEYPAPAAMIPTIKELIFAKELGIAQQNYTDTTNNTFDDIQDGVVAAANRLKQSRRRMA